MQGLLNHGGRGNLKCLIAVSLFLCWSLVSTNLLAGQGGLEAETASPNSIALSWTAPGDDSTVGTAAQYDLRYSTAAITDANWNSATQATGEPTPGAAGTHEVFTVAGLTPSTNYYFAIKTADEVGNWSVLSNIVAKATTSEITPPAAIANLSAGAATSSTVVLNWTAPGDDSLTGTAATYDIRYSTATITEANFGSATQAVGEPAPKAAGSAETFTVTGLNPNITYYFAIKTADEAPNWSALSNVVSKATSVETTPPSTIATLTAVSSTASSVTLNWRAPGDDGDVGTASQYDIRYSTATITDANWNAATQVTGEPSPQIAGTTETFSVTGLQSSTVYYFAIKTADEVPNWSGLSNIASRPTSAEQNPPAAITNLSTGTTTSTSVILNWTAPGDDGSTGTATQYDIRYSTSAITEANFGGASQLVGEPTPRVAGSAETFTVTGLTPSTTYYFAIKTADEVPNWSALSNVPSKTTLAESIPPAAITNLATGNATNTSIVLTWTAPGDDSLNGRATTYDIRYSTALITAANWNSATQVTGEPSPKSSGLSETFTVTGLQNGTLYYFAIKTADEVPNWSGLSNIPSKSTLDQIPPASIQDLSGIPGNNAGEIILFWSATGDDGYSGLAASYQLKYGTSQITEANWSSSQTYANLPAPLAAGNLQTITMSGLTPGQSYYMAMKACDDAENTSTISNLLSCTAKEGVLADDEYQAQPVSPAPGELLRSSHPTLVVQNVTSLSSNYYSFEVAADSYFIDIIALSPPVPQGEGAVTSWKISERLAVDQIYYWRAKANTFPYSKIASFAVQPTAHAYPNPYNPAVAAGVTFTDLPDGADLILMSVSGSTIREWSNVNGNELAWDGTNQSGRSVSAGTYLWFVRNSNMKGKLVIIK
ncbi:hypothetical protein TRIP_C20639 [Candidatus Zixiibacteriota bacterium]|nr:hypothetical protein TRIP_C20639 [candidate division Zixibacteria bacterium]